MNLKHRKNRQASRLLAEIHEMRFQAIANNSYFHLKTLDDRYNRISKILFNLDDFIKNTHHTKH